MHHKLKEEISDEQAGFRSGMSTRDQILNLKMVIEKNREFGKNIYLCFVDHKKAFDMVSHELLWQRMLEMGFSSVLQYVKHMDRLKTSVLNKVYGKDAYHLLAFLTYIQR